VFPLSAQCHGKVCGYVTTILQKEKQDRNLGNNQTTEPRDSSLARIGRIRELVIAEVARDFRRDRQVQAFGLLTQALLMEVRHRSRTEYA
jgi:hypothetical protein